MRQVMVVYDDTLTPNEVIQDIIGKKKHFGDVVIRKERNKEQYYRDIACIFECLAWKELKNPYGLEDLIEECRAGGEDTRVIHWFSNYILSDKEAAAILLEKVRFINEDTIVNVDDKIAAIMFCSTSHYIDFLRKARTLKSAGEAARDENLESIKTESLTDISDIFAFVKCITGNFDARYFNSLHENRYFLTKTSSDILKIKSEYTFYQLLPENMKVWFVQPFDYQETEKEASYRMERYYMTDLSIKWIYGAVELEEFNEILDKYFFFFQSRYKKEVSEKEYLEKSNALYEKKVIKRLEQLSRFPEYQSIMKFMEADGACGGISDIYTRYKELKDEIEQKVLRDYSLVIGHGDPCFSNTLYNKFTKTLKFIDPKGALDEAGMWTEPYYDLAKLSHSVCGLYDFLNNGLFDITLDSGLRYKLSVKFDNRRYKDIFKEKLAENGFDYLLVRIYEASLFLSMLPLHIDNPQKVFAFLLNTVKILKEIEKDV